MIFKAILGSSGLVPVMPIGGNKMYLHSMGIESIFEATQSFKADIEKWR